MKKIVFISLVVLLYADVCLGEDTVWVEPVPETAYWGVDQLNTEVIFSINHSDLLDVWGKIPGPGITGGAEIDDKDFTKSKFSLIFKADTITVGGLELWENIFKGEGGLDTAKYPTITFTTKKITKTGEKMQLTGALTMHGVTKDVTLDLDKPSGITSWEGQRYRAFQGKTVINRQDFGMNWREPEKFTSPIFADEIRIIMIIEVVNPPMSEAAKGGAPQGPPSQGK